MGPRPPGGVLTLLVIGAMVAAAAEEGPELRPPFPVDSVGKPLDAQLGHAAPCVADLDGDGIRDLLVGEGTGGCRIYRNLGTNPEPLFGEPRFLRAGGGDAVVPSAGRCGFRPRLADLDADGHPELLSGCATGEIVVWPGRGLGRFAAPILLSDPADKPLDAGEDSAVAPADWDGDGDVDLLVGVTTGEVFVFRNLGDPQRPRFGKPEPLTEAARPLEVADGYAAPCAADWDGDGLPDLLVGTGGGSVFLYRNSGTREKPTLSAPRVLVPSCEEGFERFPRGTYHWGTRASVECVDWNGDGLLDLLLGDVEIAAGTAFDRAAGGASDGKKEAPGAAAVEPSEETFRLAREYARMLKRRDGETVEHRMVREASATNLAERLRGLGGRGVGGRWELGQHGRVWVFLRNPPAAPASGR